MSYALRISSSLPPEKRLEFSVSTNVTRSKSWVESYYNNIIPFLIIPVFSAVVVPTQLEQNARQDQRCKENREA
jgi:hypothetical protein